MGLKWIWVLGGGIFLGGLVGSDEGYGGGKYKLRVSLGWVCFRGIWGVGCGILL